MRRRARVAIGLLAALALLLLFLRHQTSSPPVSLSAQDPLLPAETLPHIYNNTEDDVYLLGLGRGDITGPVVELNMMGYANPLQLGTGLRQRLHSRAFIVGAPSDPSERVVYLVLDIQSGDTAVRDGILAALRSLGPAYAMYGSHNVAVTATHSHSGPGGYLNYLLPQITSRGFSRASYQAIVDGAVRSIRQAHARLALGHLAFGTTELTNGNINRSPFAYLANPESERRRYDDDADKTMSVLRFTHLTPSGGETDVGVFTWYATHGTSVLANNTLISGDNKGVAAYLFERSVGDDAFVAGFSQANVADVSPNVLGAFCEYGPQAGLPCDFETSLCGGKSKPCVSRGPYFRHNDHDHGTASGFELGRRQFASARTLFDAPSSFTRIRGRTVRGVHQFTDFQHLSFPLPNGTLVKTCPAALGWSFAAGTTDWPGAFDFKQAQPYTPNANPLWKLVGHRIARPNSTQTACHGAKPVLLDVGESEAPYAWSPNIVDAQLLRIGNMFLIPIPGEASTMAGRRWRESLRAAASAEFASDFAAGVQPVVLLGGLANTYAHYITTPEEYAVQRFEGASTLHGPWTLAAHMHLSLALLPYLNRSTAALQPLDPGPQPPNNVNASLSFLTPVVIDRPGFLSSFGSIITDVRPTYTVGEDVQATFIGANPRNNLRLEGTYAAVERLSRDPVTGEEKWTTVRDDADWSLVFAWARTSTALGTSRVTVRWETRWEDGSWRRPPSSSASSSLSLAKYGGKGGGEGKERPELELRSPSSSALSRIDMRTGAPAGQDLRGTYRLRYSGNAKTFGGAVKAFEGVSGVFQLA